MVMTHYMELLSLNQPWNLIIYMALPVVLAETIAITELIILNRGGSAAGWVASLNRICGILAGLVFLVIGLYLIPTVAVPLTRDGGWRTWIDVVAVISYLLAGIPMILIALLRLGVLCRRASERIRRGRHILFLAAFLVLSHVAMIFGMADPTLAGWQGEGMHHEMSHGQLDHSQMDHGATGGHGHSAH